jgi:hypothetical protein
VNAVTLDTLMEEASGETTADAPRPPIKKLNYSHQAMADLIIADPGISQNRLAAHFGYSASWVSTVMSSDAFQAYLATRSEELVDPTVRASVQERFEGMVQRSLEILNEKLSKPTSMISDQFALKSFELASRAAGYGARTQHAPAVTPGDVHIHLESLGDRMISLLQRKRTEALVLDQEIFDATK